MYVFSEPAAGWGASPPQVTKLTAFDGAAGDDLGLSVAVSGGTVVAGAPFARVGSNAGRARRTCSASRRPGGAPARRR